MKTACLALIANLLGVSASAAWAQPAMSEFDADSDGTISEEEFATGLAQGEMYQTWDADQSGAVSSDEFTASSFRLFDRSRDGALDEEEFARAAEGAAFAAPEGAPPLDMSAFDSDADGSITEEEFTAGASALGDQSPFVGFDTDASGDISEEEFAAGAFRFNDRNRDNNLDQNEFAGFVEDATLMQQQ